MLTTGVIAAGVMVAIILGLWILWLVRQPAWMGMAGRTLWDWLVLALVPVFIGIGTVALSASQEQAERTRSQEELFLAYVDRISDLALSDASGDDAAIAVGRAQTAAVLTVLDGPRAGRVVSFLDDMELLAPYAVSLEGVNLTGAELKGVDFDGLDLEGVVLVGADLEGASLVGVDLESANLSDADLKEAVLANASMEATLLGSTNMAGADLRATDLTEAVELTSAQATGACTDETTVLPDDVAADAVVGCSSGADPGDDGDDDDEDDTGG